VQYISTRGKAPKLGFKDAVIAGLASDGGLYVPESIPSFSPEEIASMAELSYPELAFKVMQPFIAGDIPDAVLKELLEKSYQSFSHRAVAPLTQIGHQEFVLELFHGPTLAFKDFALQFLGYVFDYILTERDEYVTVIGATSGDTGSAAIEGCYRSERVSMFILHPKGRVSDVQRKQMTTVLSDNVHNLAVESDFDFCQQSVKEMFGQPEFANGRRLVAINSINWCRILAQVVYYFYAALHLGAPSKTVSFSVPTGNFGDIFAGYIAKRMGLSVGQLVIATNKNDILHRFIASNDYSRGQLAHTLSPSMDIQVASNFERFLFYLHEGDTQKVAVLVEDIQNGKMSVSEGKLEEARSIFNSHTVGEADTCRVIQEVFDKTGECLDPHTAIGVESGRVCRQSNATPMVTLATAHPAKFPAAVEKAGVPLSKLPEHMEDILSRQERYASLPADIEEIKRYIAEHI
jgi:threonine synthase